MIVHGHLVAIASSLTNSPDLHESHRCRTKVMGLLSSDPGLVRTPGLGLPHRPTSSAATVGPLCSFLP